ncbi:MAG: aldehyde ferredoxin oxidoreductase [Candidatus Methanomethylicota archaeon]|nr:MAG: aldehyde ferredoxin oxidoreductase [Candidatus Verstraetearchaeota archaeon]
MKSRGYNGKFLEVDLSREKIKVLDLEEELLEHYVGGRGVAVKFLWDRLGAEWEKVDPLGPENLLVIAAGPLTGYYPGGRICISGKSPQSNGIIGSTVGGEFGVDLRCAGYDGIIISGASKDPVYLFIKDEDVEIRDASHLWGLDGKKTLVRLTKECRDELKRRYPRFGEWKDPSILYIGPAGENLTRVAVVMEKWTHAAGYGGYGAVMGSKMLKAIVAKGSGPLPDVYDPVKTVSLINRVYDLCIARDGMRRWGTGSAGYSVGYSLSSEPIRNWQEEWHDEKSFGVDRFERKVWVKRYWGDYGCPTTCLKIAVVKTGPYAGAITDNPDYELQAYLGTNLGIFTPEGNVYVSSVIDDLGICGINGGNVLGFAGELYQRGILTKDDLDGLELKWGDPKAFAKLAEMIAYRKGIGDILAEGTFRAALKLGEMKGRDLMPYVVQVKGTGVGAHGIRSKMDYPTPIAYACSVQGGDHTSVARLPIHSSGSELIRIMCDSAVVCIFNFYPDPSLIWKFYEAVTGYHQTAEKWANGDGLRILQIQRAVLLLGGPDFTWDPRIHDDNPLRFYEPLPSGPYKGQAADRKEVEDLKRQYYEAVGWDENGIPKSEVLRKLGLESVDKALEKVRERYK